MKLVWSDEFDKDGALDPKFWGAETGFARNEEFQWYQSENASVKNGILTIEARRESRKNPNFVAGDPDWRKNREFAHYSSASFSTAGKATWQYGRFEMRGKIPTQSGMWPAWWTIGEAGEWPAGGEIDIMEFYRGKILANLVWGTNQRWNGKWNAKTKAIADFADPNWSEKFHVWAMDWTEKEIVLSVDGEELNRQNLDETINGDGSGKNPFRQPHFMILNLAIGGQNGGDPSKSTFPAKFEVDWVRVYQKQ